MKLRTMTRQPISNPGNAEIDPATRAIRRARESGLKKPGTNAIEKRATPPTLSPISKSKTIIR